MKHMGQSTSTAKTTKTASRTSTQAFWCKTSNN